jgi:ech hydrogenase subunit B
VIRLDPVALAVVVAVTLAAPIGVGLLIGADRKVTAAIQLRAGPPLVQPLYDLTKLLAKTSPPPDRLVAALLVAHVVLAAGSLALVLAGSDLLAAVLVLGAAEVLFVLAAASIESPYAQLGASRELVLLVAMEPLLVLVVIAYAVVAGSFSTGAIADGPGLPVLSVPTLGVTVAVLLAATLRKSPFDLATSHHAHQELVKGSTTEMAGRWLALAELGHWYEAALILALIALAAAGRPLLAVVLVGLTYGAVIVADNALPRATWRSALAVAWGVGGGAAIVALIATQLVAGGILP